MGLVRPQVSARLTQVLVVLLVERRLDLFRLWVGAHLGLWRGGPVQGPPDQVGQFGVLSEEGLWPVHRWALAGLDGAMYVVLAVSGLVETDWCSMDCRRLLEGAGEAFVLGV
ncbi:hypothetical protein [Streptomyces sp. KL116D]|uniref:hypothetical protein n=1 Tax=Streptomyces sp. KL116D TaxID=3045152 RepID=UPI003555D054